MVPASELLGKERNVGEAVVKKSWRRSCWKLLPGLEESDTLSDGLPLSL